jgi:hypothetical protein
MLYHVPNRIKAISEINRVLNKGGLFYASTNGINSLPEIKVLLRKFDPGIVLEQIEFIDEFGLENGGAQILEYFSDVNLYKYEDSLLITDIEPLIDYICSTTGNAKDILVGDKLKDFRNFLKNKLSTEGVLHITKDSGVFEAMKE